MLLLYLFLKSYEGIPIKYAVARAAFVVGVTGYVFYILLSMFHGVDKPDPERLIPLGGTILIVGSLLYVKEKK